MNAEDAATWTATPEESPMWIGPDLVADAGLTHVDEATRVRAFEAFDDDTRFSLVDALLADVSCRVPGYTAGDAIETAAYLSERFTITRKSATQQRSGAALEISHAQKLAWANKIDKGFNTTDIALEFGLLTAEVGEAFTAWRKRLPDLGEELADIVIYAMAIAEMNGLDLDTEVGRKIVKNSTRIYNRDAHGTPIRVTGTNPGSAE